MSLYFEQNYLLNIQFSTNTFHKGGKKVPNLSGLFLLHTIRTQLSLFRKALETIIELIVFLENKKGLKRIHVCKRFRRGLLLEEETILV